MSTILKPKRIDEDSTKFKIKTPTTISGEPDYASLNEMIQTLYYNDATLLTNIYGWKHVQFSLIMNEKCTPRWLW